MKTKKITESAILVCLATVLSIFPKFSFLPLGGSITICSMLPIAMIAYKYGVKWGLISSAVFSLIQLVTEPALPPANQFGILILCIVLDYFLAFSVIGLAGIYKNFISNKRLGFILGIITALSLRFMCHFLSGVIVWGSIISLADWRHSFLYNISYMLPEIIITSIAGYIIFSLAEKNIIDLKIHG